jgi:hypothetical protein
MPMPAAIAMPVPQLCRVPPSAAQNASVGTVRTAASTTGPTGGTERLSSQRATSSQPRTTSPSRASR